MSSPRRLPAVISLLSALAGAACAPARPAVAPTPGASISDSDARAIARAQADSARLPWTAADASFMSGMIGHHAQAIQMSRMAPTHGASAEVLRLSQRIINAQQDEIALMQLWLKDRRQPVPAAVPGPMTMTMNGMTHQMLMPGMLSEEQIRQLDAARGRDFDRLFLTFMIQHHKGAVSMVRDLFATYGAGQDESVFKLANDVNVDQSTEIRRMELMLASLSG